MREGACHRCMGRAGCARPGCSLQAWTGEMARAGAVRRHGVGVNGMGRQACSGRYLTARPIGHSPHLWHEALAVTAPAVPAAH